MAYITKDEVKAKQEKLKAINKKYSVSARFSGSNSSALRLKITKGSIDFIGNYVEVAVSKGSDKDDFSYVVNNQTIEVNKYHFENHFSGVALSYIKEVYELMLEGHFDESDIMTDYFHCAWYNRISIGAWNAPYVHN